jgi:RNA polymerase sigma-70 factor (ECF subfamily)
MSVSNPTFEALVERHSAEIHAYLWRLLRDADLASDGLQDTFLRAWRAFPKLKHHDHLRAWLYTIATHRAQSLLRVRSRSEARHTDLTDEMADPRVSVGKQVVDRETWRRVLAAVDRLPAKQRQALILRRYQELSYGEIAAVMGGTASAARTNVHLAQERLRSWLQGDDAEGPPVERRRGEA